MSELFDVVVAGGGPGGLYAACSLARQGFRVGVFEEHQQIGEPVHCTGILADEAFTEFDLSRRSILNSVTTARFYSPRGETIEYTTKQIEALVIDRRRFDQLLADEAVDAGVELHRPSRVTDVRLEPHGVVAGTADGREVRARSLILACGANYSLQRRLGLGMPGVFLHSAQMELPARRPGDVELHFGAEVAPKGFAWAVPVRRPDRTCARIGVMCEGDAASHFDRVLERVAWRWGIDRDPAVRPRQKMLPLAPIDKTYMDRLLVVGDAAGLVKATTGGGIYYSILSGAIAGEVLGSALRRDDLREHALREYETRWRERLDAEMQAQLSLRMLAQRLTDAEIESLFTLAKTNGVMPIVRTTASFNRHRRLIVALLKHPPVRQILFRRLAS
jgi:geranylgeranyl reductase family protein